MEKTELKNERISAVEPTKVNGSKTFTLVMGYDKAFTADIVDLGANPHVSVKATNVPSMRFKVWYINPLGKQYDLGYVQADGSTLSGQFYGPWRYLKNGSPL